jgi:hypothetical protein
MYTIINALLAYVNNEGLFPPLVEIQQILGSRDLRVVCIKLLGWLKSQHREFRKRGLMLDDHFVWCANLKRWIAQGGSLSDMFCISNNVFDFRPTVSHTDRKAIRALVNDKHHPPVRT